MTRTKDIVFDASIGKYRPRTPADDLYAARLIEAAFPEKRNKAQELADSLNRNIRRLNNDTDQDNLQKS